MGKKRVKQKDIKTPSSESDPILTGETYHWRVFCDCYQGRTLKREHDRKKPKSGLSFM